MAPSSTALLQPTKLVIPAGKRVSSAMDGDVKYFHVVWIPAIRRNDGRVYNDENRSLGTSARSVLYAPFWWIASANPPYNLPAVRPWEVMMLIAKGRIDMALPPAAWRRDLLGLGLLEISVDGEIGIAAAQLDLHGDPADRIIAATALMKDAILMTADQPLLQWNNALQRCDARR